MKRIIYIFLFFCGFGVFGQNLTCEDFRNGTFSASVDNAMNIEYEIIRNGNIQIETLLKIPQEILDSGFPTDSKKVKIEWLTECSYILKADDSDGELYEFAKILNDSGGVLTELVKIEGNCFHYKSTVSIEDEVFISYGKICKMNEF
ncbi:MAG: hypothetical protein ACSHXF_10115 [Aquaticitalea sp.]